MNHSILALITFLLIMPGTTVLAEHGGDIEFTDPKLIFSMPKGWADKPVKYEEGTKADVVISLDQQSYVALKDKILTYAEKTNTRIVVKEGTCGFSRSHLEKKTIDIGGFCCSPGHSDRLPDLKFHTLGIASVALIVHPDNELKNVTFQQARDLFNGNIETWSQLGLKNPYPVVPVVRLHCKKRAGHWRLLLPNEDRFSIYVHDVGVIPDMISKVAKEKNAIGFETLLMAKEYKTKGNVKPITIDGIAPEDTDALIRTAYPIYRTYGITTWTGKNKNPHAEKLVRYLLDTADDMREYHFVSHKKLRAAGWEFFGNELVGEPEVIRKMQ
ncbi:MAG: hypothetical protein OEW89_01975 [Gammaproteobacteria bacterium]|nr:hypothetical protein [Gammaproteobacteria bacterium]